MTNHKYKIFKLLATQDETNIKLAYQLAKENIFMLDDFSNYMSNNKNDIVNLYKFYSALRSKCYKYAYRYYSTPELKSFCKNKLLNLPIDFYDVESGFDTNRFAVTYRIHSKTNNIVIGTNSIGYEIDDDYNLHIIYNKFKVEPVLIEKLDTFQQIKDDVQTSEYCYKYLKNNNFIKSYHECIKDTINEKIQFYDFIEKAEMVIYKVMEKNKKNK